MNNKKITFRTLPVLQAFLDEIDAHLLWCIGHPVIERWTIRAYGVGAYLIMLTDMDEDGFQVYLPTSVGVAETLDQVKHLVMAGRLVEIPEEDDT